ncbi:MAG TPA: formylglycine-generating enzyme family protein [Planctomycetota bacterium]|nr:formylglycine-generating enzyme family protein [Planctomycetota bacterium]
MRPIFLTALLIASAVAAEAPRYPFWDGRESVESYAARVKLPAAKSFDLGGGVTLDMVLIPAGQFTMGTPAPPPPAVTPAGAWTLLAIGGAGALAALLVLIVKCIRARRFAFSLRWLLAMSMAYGLSIGGVVRIRQARVHAAEYAKALELYAKIPENEKHAHLETIEAPFYMGKFTVTQAQYEAVTGTNPSDFKGPQLPVEAVSWNDATDFCAKFSTKPKSQLGANVSFQLPTEAQWEFACRVGTTTAFNTGDTISTDEANFYGTEASPYLRGTGVFRRTTTPVGSFKPNAFGLYDTHGNVWQWCQNAYREDNSINVKTNADEDAARVVRGGSWHNDPRLCRSAIRYGLAPVHRYLNIGFRVIVPLD